MMTQWNPWKEFEALRREIGRSSEGFGVRQPSFRAAFLPGRGARQYPLINMYEDQENVYVEALAPGINPESLSLNVVRNVLAISGEKRRLPGDIKPEAFHRSERAAGRFVRSIELPVEVDEDNVHADYKHGLLVVTLPKSERAKPKQIDIQVG